MVRAYFGVIIGVLGIIQHWMGSAKGACFSGERLAVRFIKKGLYSGLYS
jgi:hypothetical protein